jgi:hypothetical protein
MDENGTNAPLFFVDAQGSSELLVECQVCFGNFTSIDYEIFLRYLVSLFLGARIHKQ